MTVQTFQKYGDKFLKPYQIQGRDWLKENPKALLADDMGLGKTIQVLSAAKDLDLRVVVVGPPKLSLDWQEEAKNVGVDLTYHSFCKIPDRVAHGSILVIEEAHWLQGGSQTQRGRKGMALALEGEQTYTWLLTGTPMRNGRPKNLLPLLEIVGLVPEKITTMDYLYRYCQPRTISTGRRLVTVYDGAANLKELAGLVSPYQLQRKKSDVLDLPPKIYCERKVPLSKPSLVRKSLQEFKDKLANLLEEKDRLDQKETLERLLIVSQIKSLSESQKLDYCKDLAEDIEGPCLWFCCYLETAKVLAETLACPKITGETDLKRRHQTIQEFQAGKHQHLVLTIRAAGVGITLTRATTEVFVGQEWAPEDNLQAEDRAYRIGQVNNLTVLKLQNSLDQHVLNLNRLKTANSQEFFQALESVKV